jgi:hypothetical protein
VCSNKQNQESKERSEKGETGTPDLTCVCRKSSRKRRGNATLSCAHAGKEFGCDKGDVSKAGLFRSALRGRRAAARGVRGRSAGDGGALLSLLELEFLLEDLVAVLHLLEN